MSTQTLLEVSIPTIVIGLTIAISGPLGRYMFWAMDPKLKGHHANLPQATDERQSALYQNGELKVDLSARRVFRGNDEMKQTKIEFDLLVTFIRHAGKVLTHRFG